MAKPTKYAIQTVSRRLPLYEKICEHCKETFTGPGNRIYCGEKCQRSASYEIYKRRHGKGYTVDAGVLKTWD